MFVFGDFCAGTPGETTSYQIDHSWFAGFYVIRVALIYRPCSVALALLTSLPFYADA